MSISITPERHRSRFDSRRRSRRGTTRNRPRPVAEYGPRTLEDLIGGTIEQLASAGPATCPVCVQPHLTTAGCGSCGAHLS